MQRDNIFLLTKYLLLQIRIVHSSKCEAERGGRGGGDLGDRK